MLSRSRYSLLSRYNRKSTLSIAIPGSILVNAQTDELRALLVSQVGDALYRTAIIFEIATSRLLEPAPSFA